MKVELALLVYPFIDKKKATTKTQINTKELKAKQEHDLQAHVCSHRTHSERFFL
jgi:hypothetical protein